MDPKMMMHDGYSPLPRACRFNSCKIFGEEDDDKCRRLRMALLRFGLRIINSMGRRSPNYGYLGVV